MDSNYQPKSTIALESKQEEKEMLPVWISVGEGGFQNANVRHHVIVVGLGQKLAYYRLLAA